MRKDVKNSHAQVNIFSRAQKFLVCMQKTLRENLKKNWKNINIYRWL